MTRKMKDSGIEWIGEIPEEWKVVTFKRVFSSRVGGAWGEKAKNNENDRICIRVADFDYSKLRIKEDIEFTKRNYTPEIIKKLELKQGDILVEKSGGGELTPVGRTIIYNLCLSALYSNFIDRLRVYNNSPNYIQYLLVSFYENGVTRQYIKQTTGIQNLDLASMLSIEKIPLPNHKEQTQIANYLDKKCSKIDETIEKQKQVIEKLKDYKQSVITEAVTKGLNPNVKMKDSGIEWIGEIPEHWKIGKVSYLYNVQLGKMLQPKQREESDTLEYYMCSANITWSGIKLDVLKQMWFSETEKENYLLKDGDLLVTEGGDVGVSCLWKNEIENCYIQNAVHRVRAKDNSDVKYLYYWLTVLKSTGYIDLICNKATIAHYTKEKLCGSLMIIPTKAEQESIVEYLDNKCSKIDKVITQKESLIEKLTEYKKSLIYECVTGKREV